MFHGVRCTVPQWLCSLVVRPVRPFASFFQGINHTAVEEVAAHRSDRLSADAPEWHPAQAYAPNVATIDETTTLTPLGTTDDAPVPFPPSAVETERADVTACTAQPTAEELLPPHQAMRSSSEPMPPPVSGDANGGCPAEENQFDRSCFGDVSSSSTFRVGASSMSPAPMTDEVSKDVAMLAGASSWSPALEDGTVSNGSTVICSVAGDLAQELVATAGNEQEHDGGICEATFAVEEPQPEAVSDGGTVLGATVEAEDSEIGGLSPACNGSADVGEPLRLDGAPVFAMEDAPSAPDVAETATNESSSPSPALDDDAVSDGSMVLGSMAVDVEQELVVTGGQEGEEGAIFEARSVVEESQPAAASDGGAVATNEAEEPEPGSGSPACAGSTDVGEPLTIADATAFSTEDAPAAPHVRATATKEPSSPPPAVDDDAVGVASALLESVVGDVAQEIVATGGDAGDEGAIVKAASVVEESQAGVVSDGGAAAATVGTEEPETDVVSPACNGSADVVESPRVADAPVVAAEEAPAAPGITAILDTGGKPSPLPAVDGNTDSDAAGVLESETPGVARHLVATDDNGGDADAIYEVASVAKDVLPGAVRERDAVAAAEETSRSDENSPACSGGIVVGKPPGVAGDAPAVTPEGPPPTLSVAAAAASCDDPPEPERVDAVSASAAIESDQAAGVDSAETSDVVVAEALPQAEGGGGRCEVAAHTRTEVMFKKSEDGARVTRAVVATPVVAEAVECTDSTPSIGRDEVVSKGGPSKMDLTGHGQGSCENGGEASTDDATNPTEDGSEPDLFKGGGEGLGEGGGVGKSAARPRWHWGVAALTVGVILVGLSRRRRGR